MTEHITGRPDVARQPQAIRWGDALSAAPHLDRTAPLVRRAGRAVAPRRRRPEGTL